MDPLTFPIVGIPTIPGQPLPLRQEIGAWAEDPNNAHQLSLFLRAVSKIKSMPVEAKLGFFQIAGIHSDPSVPWDGEPNGGEFCAHGIVTFPNWHRPYMLLYEQVLYQTMLDIIGGWIDLGAGEKSDWLGAARQFRLPYWDWARKQAYLNDYGIPRICTESSWPILEPGTGGKTVQCDNPLTGFVNPKIDPDTSKPMAMGDDRMKPNNIKDDDNLPWSKCVGTSRWGIVDGKPESEWVGGVNNWQYCNQSIADPPWYDGHSGKLQGTTLADAVSRMFSPNYFDSYETFASTKWNPPKNPQNTNFMSIEYIHNIVHNATGGPYFTEPEDKPTGFYALGLGHMSDVPVAAFDPIFYLHHCNVDRLFAMWQSLNWNMWFDKPQSDDPPSSSGLAPFHYDTGKNLWTPDRARDWRNLYYQYDDLQDMPDGEPTPEYQSHLRAYIATLYPPTSSVLADLPGLNNEDQDTFNDYIINVVYDRLALNGTAYSIMFYLGERQQPFSASQADPNFIGSVYTFSRPFEQNDGSVTCANCKQQKESKVLSKAQVPLTLPIIRRLSNIESGHYGLPVPVGRLEPDKITTILNRALKSYFVRIGGEEIDPARFADSTQITVLKGVGRHPQEGHAFPWYGKYKRLQAATERMPLGLGHALGPNDLVRDDPDA